MIRNSLRAQAKLPSPISLYLQDFLLTKESLVTQVNPSQTISNLSLVIHLSYTRNAWNIYGGFNPRSRHASQSLHPRTQEHRFCRPIDGVFVKTPKKPLGSLIYSQPGPMECLRYPVECSFNYKALQPVNPRVTSSYQSVRHPRRSVRLFIKNSHLVTQEYQVHTRASISPLDHPMVAMNLRSY